MEELMLSDVAPVCNSDDLPPEMQAALTSLAEVEARFEADRDFLAGWNGHERLKRRFIAQVEARRIHDRESLVQYLAELYQTRLTARLFWHQEGLTQTQR